MSRRNYKVEQSYIDWLKSLGCVLYLPLTQGDLQDKISGAYLIANQGASITWDNSKGAYHFSVTQQTIGNTGIQLPNVSIDLGKELSNIEYTCVIDLYVDYYSAGGTQFNILCTDGQFWKEQWYTGYNSSRRWIRLHSTKRKGEENTQYYEDGRLVYSGIQNVSQLLGTYLFTRPSWGNYGYSAFVKSAYIFNRVLTQEQINQLI